MVGFNLRPRKKKEIKRPSNRPRLPDYGRIRLEPLATKGPRPFIAKVVQTDAPPDVPPPDITATLPEWRVYWWLSKEKIQFDFQSSLMGGRLDKGGLVIDFLLPDRFPPGLVLNVQGFFWHRYTTNDRMADILTKVRLQEQGYTVVYMAEEDILDRLDTVMKAALTGRQLYPDNL